MMRRHPGQFSSCGVTADSPDSLLSLSSRCQCLSSIAAVLTENLGGGGQEAEDRGREKEQRSESIWGWVSDLFRRSSGWNRDGLSCFPGGFFESRDSVEGARSHTYAPPVIGWPQPLALIHPHALRCLLGAARKRCAGIGGGLEKGTRRVSGGELLLGGQVWQPDQRASGALVACCYHDRRCWTKWLGHIVRFMVGTGNQAAGNPLRTTTTISWNHISNKKRRKKVEKQLPA